MSTMAWFPAVHLKKPLICLLVHNVFYMTPGNLGYTSSLQITGKCWTHFHRVNWLRISVTLTFVMTRYQCREVKDSLGTLKLISSHFAHVKTRNHSLSSTTALDWEDPLPEMFKSPWDDWVHSLVELSVCVFVGMLGSLIYRFQCLSCACILRCI